MSKISRPLVSLLCAVATLLPDGPLADHPILDSRGPSAPHFPVGSSLPDDAVILLRLRDTLVIQRSVGPVIYRGPGYFRLKDEPTFIQPRRVGVTAGAGPVEPPRGRWLPPVLRRDGSESMAERGEREGFIICPGNPRCPG